VSRGSDGTRQSTYALPEIVTPVPDPDGLDAEHWKALRDERLVVQRCKECGSWQWGPEWVCCRCQSFELAWQEIPQEDGAYRGLVYSWSRVRHATHERLRDATPYIVVLVSLPAAGGLRMAGNLMEDPNREVVIGTPVRAVFEHHENFTLVQWADQ
jgi:uncharacterized OB-fold protein